jgi:hypothetical protein
MGEATPVSFGRGSNKGRFGQIGQCSHVNAYVEDVGEAGKTSYSAVCINGQDVFATLSGAAGIDTMLPLDSLLLAMAGHSLFSVNAAGGYTLVGGIPSDGFLTMARNRLTPSPQVALVRDGLAFVYSAGTLAQLLDSDLPPPIFVFELQGYFIFLIADGRWFLAGPNNASVDPLDFAEAEAGPDGLVGGVARGRTGIFFGAQTTEFWDPNGDVTFPFAFTTAINFGCYAAGSIAKLPVMRGGQAQGSSIDDTVVFAATDHAGAYYGIATLNGYTPSLISTPEVDRAVQSEPDPTSIRSMGFTENGRPVYIISGTSFTYSYDGKSQTWQQRKSKGLDRWRPSCHAQFAGKVLFGSSVAAVIYRSDRSLDDEAGDPIVWQIQTPSIHMWPRGFTVKTLWADMITGVGKNSGIDADDTPEVIIDYSKDGGDSWGAESRHSLGTMAQRYVRVKRRGMGRFDHNGMTLRLTCSARVARGLQQLAIKADPLRG